MGNRSLNCPEDKIASGEKKKVRMAENSTDKRLNCSLVLFQNQLANDNSKINKFAEDRYMRQKNKQKTKIHFTKTQKKKNRIASELKLKDHDV